MALDRRRVTGNYLPLREAMDRLFDGSFISPQMIGGQNAFPAANVHVSDDNLVIEMAVPGVNPDDIAISITGDTVTISGETKREQRDRKGQTYVEEIWEGAFQRSFALPFPADVNKANATFENGKLRLTLPKSEAAKPRTIQVSQQPSTAQQAASDQQGQQSQAKGQVGEQSQAEQSSQPAASNVQKETVSTGTGKSS